MRASWFRCCLVLCAAFSSLVFGGQDGLKPGDTWYYSSDKKMMAAVMEEMKLRGHPFHMTRLPNGLDAVAYSKTQQPVVETVLRELIGEPPPGYTGLCSPQFLSRETHIAALNIAGIPKLTANPKFTGEFCVFWSKSDDARVLEADPIYREIVKEQASRHANK
jgi:hypothetical protein